MTDGISDEAGTSRAESPAIAIVGVGNEIMGDDGLGPTTIRRLQESPLESAADVRLVNAGTTAFLALEAMSGADRAVVLDAIRTGDDPGEIQEYRCVDGAFEEQVPEVTMHDVSFTEALVAGRDVYDLPAEIRILGVEPAEVSPGVGLSDDVEAAMADVGTRVIEELRAAEVAIPSGVDDEKADPAVDDEEVDGEEVDGDEVDGDEVDGDEVDGDEVDGDEVDGDEVDGEEVDGDEVDGEEVDDDGVGGHEVDTAVGADDEPADRAPPASDPARRVRERLQNTTITMLEPTAESEQLPSNRRDTETDT